MSALSRNAALEAVKLGIVIGKWQRRVQFRAKTAITLFYSN
jgi:hypothetical protein